MFVTTAGRTNREMEAAAKVVADILQIPYVIRKKRSVMDLQKSVAGPCIVVGKERLELFAENSHEPFFFHPNSAMFRMKRIEKGEYDPFIEAAQLKKGMSLLDCTLGLASDATVASYIVGETGKVVGLEAQKYLAFLVKQGLANWNTGNILMNKAMRNVSVLHRTSLEYLRGLDDRSYDCVYFDPMFEEKIIESNGIKALDLFAIHDDLTEELMSEANRVSSKRVILKDHYLSKRFERYGFKVFRRKTSKFHYGVIEKEI